MANSAWIWLNAGATIDDDTGDTNMNSELSTVMPQRFPLLQFLGFAGSSGPSHVTLDEASERMEAV